MARHVRPYSAPQYYDIAFNVFRKAECDFLEGCFVKHAVGPVRRVLDIACGTGQHLIRLARRGYAMTGLDLSAESLAYVNARAAKAGLLIEVIQADMTDSRLDSLGPRAAGGLPHGMAEPAALEQPFDAAICMQDSQGHLLTNEAILSHFKAVAHAVRPGGLYIFDRMIPNNWAHPATRWSWTRRRGRTTVRAIFRTMLDIDEVSQVCREEITLEVQEGARRKIIRQRYPTRVVFPQELRALIALNGQFELVAWHPNFHLHRRLEDSKHPLMIVAVLRRI